MAQRIRQGLLSSFCLVLVCLAAGQANTEEDRAKSALDPKKPSLPPDMVEVAAPPCEVESLNTSFATHVINSISEGETPDRTTLLDHPALSSVVAHQALSGNPNADRAASLDRMLAAPMDVEGTQKVLGHWQNRDTDICEYVMASEVLLPCETAAQGVEKCYHEFESPIQIRFIVGYDIAVVAPPEILINAAHPHFTENPGEVGPYLTHEAHHIGFLELRKIPALDGLDDPLRLAEIAWYFTQMEGMAVHAAYGVRQRENSLEADEDYAIYLDEGTRKDVIRRYGEVLATLEGKEQLTEDEVGAFLTAMSSGERLWYRFGAMVAWDMQQQGSIRALTDTIEHPEQFREWGEALLARLGESSPAVPAP